MTTQMAVDCQNTHGNCCEPKNLENSVNADVNFEQKPCPRCRSFNTVKEGKPLERSHGTVQPYRCKNCRKYFSLGRRKVLRVFLKGREIYRCSNPPGLQPVPGIVCPACGQEKAVLKSELKTGPEQGRKTLICFGCGRKFTQGAPGTKRNTYMSRRLGAAAFRRPWQFEDDKHKDINN